MSEEQQKHDEKLDAALTDSTEKFLQLHGIENAIIVISNPDTNHVIFKSRGPLPTQLGLLRLNTLLLEKEV